MFGFISVDSKTKCLESCAILTNQSMKKVKLEHHQILKHPMPVDGAPSMTGKMKGFVSRMKSAAPHIFHICCLIQRQSLAAKNIGGDMEEPLNNVIHAINFVKANSVIDRLYGKFLWRRKFQAPIASHKRQMVSKSLSLARLVNLWEPIIKFKSEMIDYNSRKQANKAETILEGLSKFKTKIFYLSDIFKNSKSA
ncbi:unnamed protein product [Lepeophtheirus salmonis]|uniref:(salmon louse) hypothetical protein n=1 Tax=Lepeophtheirus salmonis TaxID=72036 RepID=A0A7R8D2V3_LEPSM|nr:unnamed protein product [Lepeophtheirus salmonis]CAF3009469.1 unnamed protein product [Lepeophtheirus salmonis]